MERFLLIVGFIILLYQLLKRLFGKQEIPCSEKPNLYLTVISIVLVFSVNYAIIFFGSKVPGSLLERNEYETMLYVHLYPDEQQVKSYKVPAKVRREVTEDCYPGNDGDTECTSWKEYFIEYAIMPNVGRIYFDSDTPLELDRIIMMFDESTRYWGVQLTNEASP